MIVQTHWDLWEGVMLPNQVQDVICGIKVVNFDGRHAVSYMVEEADTWITEEELLKYN